MTLTGAPDAWHSAREDETGSGVGILLPVGLFGISYSGTGIALAGRFRRPVARAG